MGATENEAVQTQAQETPETPAAAAEAVKEEAPAAEAEAAKEEARGTILLGRKKDNIADE